MPREMCSGGPAVESAQSGLDKAFEEVEQELATANELLDTLRLRLEPITVSPDANPGGPEEKCPRDPHSLVVNRLIAIKDTIRVLRCRTGWLLQNLEI